MTEQKRNPNPFIRMAQQAQEQKENSKNLETQNKLVINKKITKNSQTFGNKIIKKTGRA